MVVCRFSLGSGGFPHVGGAADAASGNSLTRTVEIRATSVPLPDEARAGESDDRRMATVTHYERPRTLDEALRLLERPTAVVLAGGTHVNAVPSEPVEMVDLQSLGLGGIARIDTATLRFGALLSLQELADSPEAPAVIRDAARRERPSTLRTQATLGGTLVVADRESELLAALLAHDAHVSVVDRSGSTELALETLLETLPLSRGRIVVSVTIATDGRSFAARTGRTRADRPIVAVVARVTPDGETRVAACGVAATPILVESIDDLDPPADFRGSGEYRRSLAEILAARALAGVS